MIKRLELIGALLLVLLIGRVNIANSAETQYASIGWWTIVYEEFSNFNTCSARAVIGQHHFIDWDAG
jgi:hypothetical protein